MVIIRKACFSCYKRGNIVIRKRASLCIKNVPGFIKNKERLKKKCDRYYKTGQLLQNAT